MNPNEDKELANGVRSKRNAVNSVMEAVTNWLSDVALPDLWFNYSLAHALAGTQFALA